jgi:hypothetical protein
MKYTVFTLPLAASAAIVHNVPRQLGLNKPLPFAGSKETAPQINSQAKRVHLRWGPVQLLPKSVRK